jgi:hypothetical protein
MKLLQWVSLALVLAGLSRPSLGVAVADTPVGLDAAIGQLSERLASAVERGTVKTVVVLEFANGQGTLAGNIGIAGRHTAARLGDQLQSAGLQVVEPGRLQAALKDAKLSYTDLDVEPERLAALRDRIGDVDVVVLGSITRLGLKINVRVRLIRLSDGSRLDSVSLDLEQDGDLAALFGDSVSSGGGLPVTKAEMEKEVTRRIADLPPTPPSATAGFAMDILVGDQVLPRHVSGSDLVVPMRVGDKYRVRLANRSTRRVGAVLLIDGFSSYLMERGLPSGLVPWVMAPGETIEVPGWYLDDAWNEFLIGGVPDSVAGQARFVDQVGQITAVFFPEATGDGETKDAPLIATGKGDRIETTKPDSIPFVGQKVPLAVLTLRYAEAAQVQELPRAQ